MKRIFMLSRQLLFSQGVESLLSEQPGLEIVGRETNPEKAMEQIREVKPDVVILDSRDLESAPSGLIALILKESPESRVVTLNLANDQVRVYHGEQYSAQNIDDLLDVMNEEASSHSQISCQEWSSLAESRAQVYGFHSAIYSQEIDGSQLENLVTGSLGWMDSLQSGEDLTGDLSEGIHSLEGFRRRFANHPLEATQTELAAEYVRLLQGDRPGEPSGGACEEMYIEINPECEPPASAISQVYAEAGIHPVAERPVRPDFIGCEFDFMYQLCLREAAAWKEHNRSTALRYQEIERGFLRDHLARWVPRFCDAMLRQATNEFYRGIAYLTKGFILNEAYRVAEMMEWVSSSED